MKLDDIARLAGVSRTIASYVINGKAKQYRVSIKTEAKVLAVVAHYNYQPNVIAAGLRDGHSRSIGLILPDLENPSYSRIASLLEQRVRLKGYQLLIASSNDNPLNEMHCVEHFLQRRVEALVISSTLPAEHPFYSQQIDSNLPIIALDRALSPKHFSSIVGDDQRDAKILARALKAYNFSSLLFLGAAPELSVSALREKGFREGWGSDSRPVEFLYSAGYHRQQGRDIFEQFIRQRQPPEALFISAFALLQGAIDACIQYYGQLPKKLIIATFGDHELLDFLPCPVLAVGQRHQEIVNQLVLLLLSSINNSAGRALGLHRVTRVLHQRGNRFRQK